MRESFFDDLFLGLLDLNDGRGKDTKEILIWDL